MRHLPPPVNGRSCSSLFIPPLGFSPNLHRRSGRDIKVTTHPSRSFNHTQHIHSPSETTHTVPYTPPFTYLTTYYPHLITMSMSTSNSNVLLASDIAKDTRDFLRARQLQLKPHDRSKTKRMARSHCFESVRPEKQAHGGRKTRQAASSSDVNDVEAREPLGPLPSSQPTARTWDEIVRSFDGLDATTAVEVPLTSLIKPTKPKYGKFATEY